MTAQNPNHEHKFCHACTAWLGIEEFHRDRTRPDGRHVWCKLCRRDPWVNIERGEYGPVRGWTIGGNNQ